MKVNQANQVVEKKKNHRSASFVEPRRPKYARGPRKLADNFYERLLILEMEVKNKFSLNTLNELVALYTSAIEYYEGSENSKFKDYQIRMDVLLSDPDILKKMNDAKGKLVETEEHVQSRIRTKTKNDIRLKVDYKKGIPNDIEKQLGGILQKNKPENVSALLNDEINKQNEKWKLKLQMKKTLKSKSNIGSPKADSVLQRGKTLTPATFNSGRISAQIGLGLDINLDKKEKPVVPHSQMQKQAEKEKEDEEKEEEKKEEEKKEEEKKEEKDEEPKVETDEELQRILNDKLDGLDNLVTIVEEEEEKDEEEVKTEEQKEVPVPVKYQDAHKLIEERINYYMNEFNRFFYKDIFRSFFLELKKLIDEKYEKYIEISVNYHSQIKENEFLLDSTSTDEAQESIKQSIELLKEDRDHQIGIVEFQYDSLINQKISDFKMASFKNNAGIQLIEEKLKFDIYQIINEAF